MKFCDIFPDMIETKRTQRTKKKRLPREPKVKAEKCRHHSNQVVCLDSGQQFVSIKEAAIATGANASTIGACCRGVKLTAGGYKWQYLHRATHRISKNSLNAAEYRKCLEQIIPQYFGADNSTSANNLFLINREHQIECITSSARETLACLSFPFEVRFAFSYANLENIYSVMFDNPAAPESATAMVAYIRQLLEIQNQVFTDGIAIAFAEKIPQGATINTLMTVYVPLFHESGEVIGILASITPNAKLPLVDYLDLGNPNDDVQSLVLHSVSPLRPMLTVINEEIRGNI